MEKMSIKNAAPRVQEVICNPLPAPVNSDDVKAVVQAAKGEEVDIDTLLPVANRASSGASPEDTYTIVWGPDGPLGLTVDAIPNSTGAYIKRTTGSGAAAHLTEDSVGDEMTHINTIDVRQMEFSRIVAYLKKVPRSVSLRFRKDSIQGRSSAIHSRSSSKISTRTAPPISVPPFAASLPSQSRQYELNWTEGSLGLSLHAADDKSDYPYITRVTGVGCAAHLPSTAAGDQLRSINGSDCHASKCTFNDVMDQLKKLPKPILLRFAIAVEDPLRPLSRQVSSSSSVHNGNEDDSTCNQLHTPFIGAPKLSTGRRQKIVKQLKKYNNIYLSLFTRTISLFYH